jgi:hypothetical protein
MLSMMHINQFIDRIKTAESRNTRDFIMSLQDARNLHADITKLLLRLEELADNSKQDSVIQVEVTGGNF